MLVCSGGVYMFGLKVFGVGFFALCGYFFICDMCKKETNKKVNRIIFIGVIVISVLSHFYVQTYGNESIGAFAEKYRYNATYKADILYRQAVGEWIKYDGKVELHSYENMEGRVYWIKRIHIYDSEGNLLNIIEIDLTEEIYENEIREEISIYWEKRECKVKLKDKIED